MRTYWSNSKFADWVRGTKQPTALTSEGWKKWNKEAQLKHPFRYWMAEEALDNIQRFVYWPYHTLSDIYHYLDNRFISRTHVLTSRLAKGKWHEMDERLIHCMFDELIRFVEVELASHYIVWNQDDPEVKSKYKMPNRFNWRWRSAEAGMDYLKWASQLTDKEFRDEDDKHNAQLTPQAIAAQETMCLYNWWKHVRPNRIDAGVLSGLDEASENNKKEMKKCFDKYREIEYNYLNEDEDMMVRLIKIRQHLWS